MSSKSGSCFGTFLLILIALFALRLLWPEVWLLVLALFRGAFYLGIVSVAVLLAVIGFFTYRNLRKNKKKQAEQQFRHVSQSEALYRSVVERLQKDLTLNQVSAEELLQSEILIGEKLREVQQDLFRLKEFASPRNEAEVRQQIREYNQQLQQSKDPAVKEVIAENLKILNEKQQRIEDTLEEIRHKEASVDLIYHSLVNVDENLKFGRPIRRLFSPEIYTRFQLTPPAESTPLTPLTEKSSME